MKVLFSIWAESRGASSGRGGRLEGEGTRKYDLGRKPGLLSGSLSNMENHSCFSCCEALGDPVAVRMAALVPWPPPASS